jgi:hypothetical protein
MESILNWALDIFLLKERVLSSQLASFAAFEWKRFYTLLHFSKMKSFKV